MAGVPVYSQQGRNGGWQLLGGGRTDLSGLTADEARALFLVAGPASATPEVRTALRKLVRALPETMRDEAEAASDGGGHRRRVGPVAAHRADAGLAPGGAAGRGRGRAGRARLRGRRRRRDASAPCTRSASPPRARPGTSWPTPPPGCARSGSTAWWRPTLTDRGRPCGPRGSTWRRRGPRSARRCSGGGTRPRCTRLARPDAMDLLQRVLGTRLLTGPPAPDGRVEVAVTGPTERAVVGELAGFGAMLEITGPPSARAALREIADDHGAPSWPEARPAAESVLHPAAGGRRPRWCPGSRGGRRC